MRTAPDTDRRLLWQLSYRLTGSSADADDVVQETYARLLEHRPSPSRPLRPWLVQVASRLSIDRLRERQARPYVGPWLPALVETSETDEVPEPGSEPGDEASSADARYDLRESATLAFLVALEVLSPAQRAALVLRDVFELSALETAEALGLEAPNVRQLHHRARAALERYEADRCIPDAAVRARSRELLEALLAALISGDAAEAAKVLRADVVALSDGGGQYSAARVPVVGLQRVFLLYRRLAELRTAADLQFVLCNGLWAVELRFEHCGPGEAPRVISGVVPAAGGARLVYSQLVPDKLPRRPRAV